jgi:hypothetical protein
MTGHIKSHDHQSGGGAIVSSSGEEIPFRESALGDRRWIPTPGAMVTFEVIHIGSKPLAVWVCPGARWRSHGST